MRDDFESACLRTRQQCKRTSTTTANDMDRVRVDNFVFTQSVSLLGFGCSFSSTIDGNEYQARGATTMHAGTNFAKDLSR